MKKLLIILSIILVLCFTIIGGWFLVKRYLFESQKTGIVYLKPTNTTDLEKTGELYIYNVDNDTEEKITNTNSNVVDFIVSPNNKKVAYVVYDKNEIGDIFQNPSKYLLYWDSQAYGNSIEDYIGKLGTVAYEIDLETNQVKRVIGWSDIRSGIVSDTTQELRGINLLAYDQSAENVFFSQREKLYRGSVQSGDFQELDSTEGADSSICHGRNAFSTKDILVVTYACYENEFTRVYSINGGAVAPKNISLDFDNFRYYSFYGILENDSLVIRLFEQGENFSTISDKFVLYDIVQNSVVSEYSLLENNEDPGFPAPSLQYTTSSGKVFGFNGNSAEPSLLYQVDPNDYSNESNTLTSLNTDGSYFFILTTYKNPNSIYIYSTEGEQQLKSVVKSFSCMKAEWL